MGFWVGTEFLGVVTFFRWDLKIPCVYKNHEYESQTNKKLIPIDCTFYHFYLLVPCHNNFVLGCLCILNFRGIVELENFFVSCNKGLVKFQVSWEYSVLGRTKNFGKAINDQSCKSKNSWWQNYLCHVCMLTFLTFIWEYSAWEMFVCSSVHSKSKVFTIIW